MNIMANWIVTKEQLEEAAERYTHNGWAYLEDNDERMIFVFSKYNKRHKLIWRLNADEGYFGCYHGSQKKTFDNAFEAVSWFWEMFKKIKK